MKVLVEISIDDEWLKKMTARRPETMSEEQGRHAALRAMIGAAGTTIGRLDFDFDVEVRAYDGATSYVVRRLAS